MFPFAISSEPSPNCHEIPAGKQDIHENRAPVIMRQIMSELQELRREPSPPTTGGAKLFWWKVNEPSALARNSRAHFVRELCDLLVNLEAASHEYAKKIAFWWKKMSSKIQKVKGCLEIKIKTKTIVSQGRSPRLLDDSLLLGLSLPSSLFWCFQTVFLWCDDQYVVSLWLYWLHVLRVVPLWCF
jgi:hypothetical protein